MSEPSNSSPVSGATQPAAKAGGVSVAPDAQGADTSQESNIQFRSSEIGKITARQEDPFKEHKARAAERKKQNEKTRKMILIILIVGLLILLTGLGIWWIIATLSRPEPEEMTFLQDETIKDIQTSANEIYNAESDDSDEQNIEGAVEYYEEQKNEAATIDDRNRITIAEMLFYAANSYPERVVEVGDGINPDDLPLDEALTYCNAVVNAWNSLGEPENAEQCEEFIENNTMIDTNGVG